MAKLQKTLSTIDSVASVGRPAPQRDFVGEAVQGVGNLIEGAIHIEGERQSDILEDDFGGLAADVASLRANEEVEIVTDRMKRLAKGAKQGRLSDTAIKLETEALLKSAIEKNPLFASKLRRRAAEVLGFDPTGTEMQALLGFGHREPARPLTPSEKRRMKAQGFADLGLGSVDDLEILLAKAELGESQTQFVTDQAKRGEVGASAILNVSLNNVDSYVSDAAGELMVAIQEGGITAVNSTMRVAQLNQSLESAWTRHRKALTDGGINLSASKLGEQRRLFDQKFEPIREMFADDATMEVILTKQNRALIAQASINGFDMFPGLAAVNAAVGQAGVSAYFDVMSSTASESQIELIKRNNPAFAAIADNKPEMARAMRSSFNRIMGIPTQQVGVGGVPELVIPGLDDQVSHKMVKDTKEPVIRDKVVDFLSSKGQPFKDMSHYGQKGVRALATDKEVKFIVEQRWGVEFEPLVGRIASSMKGVEGLSLSVSGGVIKIESVGAVAANAPPSMAILGNAAQIPAGLAIDIKRLNSMNQLVQNGWAEDVGVSAFGFLEKTINRVETLRADQGIPNAPDKVGQAMEAVLRSPTPENMAALEKLSPDIFAAARSRVVQSGGSDGK